MLNLDEVKRQYNDIEKLDYIIDVQGYDICFDLMWIREIVKKGGQARRAIFHYPTPLLPLICSAINSLFPNRQIYTYLDSNSITDSATHIEGKFVCGDGLYMEISVTSHYITFTFYYDANKYTARDLENMIRSKVVEIGSNTLIDLNLWQYLYRGGGYIEGSEDEVVESGAPSSISIRDDSETHPFSLRLDEFLEGYSAQTQNALLRILHMVDSICAHPSKGLHFSAVLAGEPGTGKSMFAKYAAERAKRKGATVFYGSGVRGNDPTKDLLVFALHNFPLVLFVFDEGERIAANRDEYETSTLPYLMQLMDGYVSAPPATWGLIITTNRPHVFDPAFLRPVRLDEFVVLDAPKDDMSFKVFTLWCNKLGVAIPNGVQPSWFAGKTHAECAALAIKIHRMQQLGKELTATDIKEMLRLTSTWAKPQKVKGVRTLEEGNIGFRD